MYMSDEDAVKQLYLKNSVLVFKFMVHFCQPDKNVMFKDVQNQNTGDIDTFNTVVMSLSRAATIKFIVD